MVSCVGQLQVELEGGRQTLGAYHPSPTQPNIVRSSASDHYPVQNLVVMGYVCGFMFVTAVRQLGHGIRPFG